MAYFLLLCCLFIIINTSCNSSSSAADSNPAVESSLKNVQYTYNIIVLSAAPAIQPLPANQQTVSPPADMIFVPGGDVYMGSTDGLPEEQPRFWARLQPFFMDRHEVTVAQFRKFISATGYKTDAEKFGNSGVFVNNKDNWWMLKDGAMWEYPQGRDKPKAKDNHPVTQVSWRDATAYAKWAGKRLPSEIEWEHAARNGNNSQARYSWGDDAKVAGKWMLNFFQGAFPETNNNEDGFIYTAPIGKFGQSALGLEDISGNVWEWCADDKIGYGDLINGDLQKKDTTQKAMRGGSFLCETARCHGYRVSSRSFSTPETSLMHIGFRCVKDIPKK